MRALSSAQAPPKPRSPASKCAALRRGSGQLQRHCDCGGIKPAGLQACQMRFCSPILMHHDADGKELGEFSGFSNADFRGKMDDRGICDFSPDTSFRYADFGMCFLPMRLVFSCCRGISLLRERPKGNENRRMSAIALWKPSQCTLLLLVCSATCGYGGQCG